MNAKVQTKVDNKIRAATIVELLKLRHPSPEWLTMDEVVVAPRRFDFLAARLWGDSHHVLGFEVKVERGDFLKEMSDPDKRRALEQRCHAAYFVAPAGVIAKTELPQGWGLIELAGVQLREKVVARHRNKCELVHESVFSMVRKMMAGKEPKKAPDRSIFKYAGQDLTTEQLLEQMKMQFGDSVEEAKKQLRNELQAHEHSMRDSTNAERLDRMRATLGAIAKRLDMSVWDVQNADAERWLHMLDRYIAARCPIQLLEQVKRSIHRYHEQIDEAITDLTRTKEVAA